MEELEKKLIRFQKIVEQEAIERKLKIEEEIKELKKQKIEAEKKRLQEESERKLAEKKAKIESEYKQQVSKEMYQYKKELLMKRDEIIAHIFQDVSKKLEEYRKSEEYVKYLQRILEEAAESFHCSAFTIYYKEEDKPLTKKLEEKLSVLKLEWISDASILLGGFIIKKSGTNVITDETFDQKLREAEEKFIYDSGLALDDIE